MSGPMRGLMAGLIALAVTWGGAHAEDRMRATLDQSAVLTAALSGPLMTDTPGPLRLHVSIVAFTPPRDRKSVEIVVSASAPPNGAPHELGRVAITPYAAFGARDTARHQYFAFHIPDDIKSVYRLTVSVALHPVNGGGTGASLEVGEANIR